MSRGFTHARVPGDITTQRRVYVHTSIDTRLVCARDSGEPRRVRVSDEIFWIRLALRVDRLRRINPQQPSPRCELNAAGVIRLLSVVDCSKMWNITTDIEWKQYSFLIII